MASIYQRSQQTWVAVLPDSDKLAQHRAFIDAQLAAIDAHLREALRPLDDGLEPRTIQVVCALVDYPTWQCLTDRNLQPDEIIDELCRLVLSCVKRRIQKVS